jgi:PAS domain S-box-containing protein
MNMNSNEHQRERELLLEKIRILTSELEECRKTEKIVENFALQLTDLYNNAPCGYHSLDNDGLFMLINDTELTWLGYTRDEVIHKMNILEILTPESREIFFQNFPRFKVTGTLKDLELEMIRKDGTSFPILLNATAVYDDNRTFLMSRSSIFDISQMKQSQEMIEMLNTELTLKAEALENSNLELESFASSICHDLHAPLRAIEGFSKIALEEYGEKLDAEGNRLLTAIRSHVRHMSRLLTELLSLSKVSNSEMHPGRIDMRQMAKSIYFEMTMPEIRNNIDFIVHDIPDILADPVLIRLVWSNLISNAIKFTTPKRERKIEIDSIGDKEMTTYLIRDNGVGFNPTYANRLFDVFKKLHSSPEFEGTGIGLAIAQRIIHRHGGKIRGEGEVGKGAIFYFSLPALR